MDAKNLNNKESIIQSADDAFFFVLLQASSARGHKPIASEGKRHLLVSACLMLVADRQVPCAFLFYPFTISPPLT